MIQNKYSKWYFSIINNAIGRCGGNNKETHHIFPKSLGGTNKKENLVDLTPREHFICHVLLTKMTSGEDKKKMCWALHRMAYSGNYKISSKQYDLIRKIHRDNVSINHPAYTTNGAWVTSVSLANKEHWKDNITRREVTSKRMSLLWENNHEIMTKHSRKNGLKSDGKQRLGKKYPHEGEMRRGNKNPSAKIFVIMDNNGNIYEVDNLKEFCLKNNLRYDSMCNVSRGATKQHKGFVVISKSLSLSNRQKGGVSEDCNRY